MKTINDMDKALRILIKLLTGFYCQHGCCYATSSNQKEEKCTASSTLTLSTYGSLISLIQAPLHVWNHSRGLLSDHGSDSFSISGLWMAVKYFYCHASTWTRQTQHRKKSGGEHSRNIMSTTKKKCVKVSRDRLEADVRDGIFGLMFFANSFLLFMSYHAKISQQTSLNDYLLLGNIWFLIGQKCIRLLNKEHFPFFLLLLLFFIYTI